MKIYFASSLQPDNTRDDIALQILNYIRVKKHEVIEKSFHDQEWNICINQCDIAIMECSYPSNIQIGLEIGLILEKGKPVILVYKEGSRPFVADKLYSSRLIISEYDPIDLEETLDWCFDEVRYLTSKRFTFFISAEMENFVSQISLKEKISKSEFIRSLIKKEMKKDSDTHKI
jgi:hypothetical protein